MPTVDPQDRAFDTTDGITNLLYVATHLNLCCNPIPGEFVPDMGAIVAPVTPPSLDLLFGTGCVECDAIRKSYFERFYNREDKVWIDGDSNVVPADLRAEVLIAQNSIDAYLVLRAAYDYTYNTLREAQWRAYMAQQLIDACEP